MDQASCISNTNMKEPRLEERIPARRNPSPAFTRVELLVVLTLFALLATLGLSARAGSKDQSLIAQCASNLRQFALALQIYGNEYSDRLPSNQAGAWPIDVPWNTGSLLLQYLPGAGSTQSVSWHTFYCPGTGFRFTDLDNYRLWNYAPDSYRLIGYAGTFPGTSGLNPTNLNQTLTPQPIRFITTDLPAPKPSQRILLADSMMSQPGQNNPFLKYTYNWTDIVGGYTVHHTSPHLEEAAPLGGNVATLDGHVEWRKFQVVISRTVGNTTPVWWW